jgi:hypothetical protein
VIKRSQNAFARSWPRNIELERHGRVLTAEKAEACAVLPLWMTAHAHTSVDVATYLGVRLLPIFTTSQDR